MDIKDILKEHETKVMNEEEEFKNAIREETKDLTIVEAAAAIIKALVEQDGGPGTSEYRQVFNCRCTINETEFLYSNSYDDGRWFAIETCWGNGYIDLTGLTDEEYDDVKVLLNGIIKCEW